MEELCKDWTTLMLIGCLLCFKEDQKSTECFQRKESVMSSTLGKKNTFKEGKRFAAVELTPIESCITTSPGPFVIISSSSDGSLGSCGLLHIACPCILKYYLIHTVQSTITRCTLLVLGLKRLIQDIYPKAW